MASVTAPNSAFDGTVGGVNFTAGKAETDNAAALRYFRAAGYTVTAKAAAKKATATKPAPKGEGEGEQ